MSMSLIMSYYSSGIGGYKVLCDDFVYEVIRLIEMGEGGLQIRHLYDAFLYFSDDKVTGWYNS